MQRRNATTGAWHARCGARTVPHAPDLHLAADPLPGATLANIKAAECASPPAAPAPATAYKPGDALLAVYPLPGGGVVRARFAVPVPGASAVCDDSLGQLGFLERLPRSLKVGCPSASSPVTPCQGCTRPTSHAGPRCAAQACPALARSCGPSAPPCAASPLQESAVSCLHPLPSGPAFRDLCLQAASPLLPQFYAGMQFPPNPAAPGALAVTVSSITTVDPATGIASTAGPGAAPAAPAYRAVTAVAPAACIGVVTRVDWLFRYTMDAASGEAQLVSASAALTLGTATDGGAPLLQAASVSWAVPGAPAGALVPLSGAPGYLEGFPLLAGVKQAGAGGKAAVARWVGGLQLPVAGAGGGACAAAAGAAVAFGYNATSTCAARMTAAQLAAFCGGGDAAAVVRAAAGGLLGAALAGNAVIGIWGNSDAANAAEWVPLVATGWPVPPPAWSAAQQRCDGVVTGFDVKLVTGAAASAANPQRKVLHAQLCPRLGAWAFDAHTAAAAAGSGGGAAAQQALPLTFGASFAALDQGAPIVRLRPAPPLVIPLPRELFYPFL